MSDNKCNLSDPDWGGRLSGDEIHSRDAVERAFREDLRDFRFLMKKLIVEEDETGDPMARNDLYKSAGQGIMYASRAIKELQEAWRRTFGLVDETVDLSESLRIVVTKGAPVGQEEIQDDSDE